MNWLNKNTPEWDEVVEQIKTGRHCNVWGIRQEYMVSKMNEQILQELINIELKQQFIKWKQTNH